MISAKETSSYLVSLTSVCSQAGSTAVTRVSQIKLTNNKKNYFRIGIIPCAQGGCREKLYKKTEMIKNFGSEK